MTKILVVDDSRLHRTVAAAVLREGGYETAEAEDGLEALAKITPENPDLIVLDRVMPKIDGTEVCRRLRADPFTQHIPVLMLTTLDTTSDKVEGLKLGADGYLTKPFVPEELLATVEALLRRGAQYQPLTGLPGAPLIQKRIDARIPEKGNMAVCYLDIDHFKPYNDKYGVAKGDEVILFLAQVIREAIEGQAAEFFVGHIGGDDFIAVTAPQEVDALCRSVIERFDAGIADHYSAEDRERSYIEAKDRQGVMRRWPIMTLSVAVVTNERREFLNYAQVGEVLAELKAYAKSQPGSTCVKDRRAG